MVPCGGRNLFLLLHVFVSLQPLTDVPCVSPRRPRCGWLHHLFQLVLRGNCWPCSRDGHSPAFVHRMVLSWIPWNLSFRYILFHEKKTSNDAVTSQCQSQFTPKMKANAVLRLLSSLVWIDPHNECNGMTSFMKFMIYNVDIIEECIRDKIWFRCIVPYTILYGKNIGLHVLKLNNW